MKDVYFYPTKRNTLIGFLVAQLLPLIFLGLGNKYTDVVGWLQFELVIMGCISLWQVKPVSQLDEREKNITLKWKSCILDYGSSLILIPIVVLCLRPEISGWNLFNLSAVPVFIVFVACSMLTKRELGYYFYEG